jgi:RNA polymerase sigma-70 factor (ECF subfamily)
VARRHEKRVRPTNSLPTGLQTDDTGPAKAFDREWARALCREAALAQEAAAGRSGPAAVRRVRLLRLRFHDGLPIREIARRLGEDPDRLHHEYAVARDEFQAALRAVVAFHHPEATAGEIDRECEELTGLLS